MIKQGKTIIIGISSIIGVVAGSKMVSFPDEKLTTDSLKGTISNEPALKPTEKNTGFFQKQFLLARNKKVKKNRQFLTQQRKALINKVIKTGLSRIGTPYMYGGTTEKGFDCSGFVHYAFKKFNINVPRSSSELAEAGRKVKLHETRKGDILIFTGTNVDDRNPGHVGIVISKAGEPIEFVHSSSNGGVKISKVEGTNYERRFLETRRVL